jgi:hypothetical protein
MCRAQRWEGPRGAGGGAQSDSRVSPCWPEGPLFCQLDDTRDGLILYAYDEREEKWEVGEQEGKSCERWGAACRCFSVSQATCINAIPGRPHLFQATSLALPRWHFP